MRHLERLKRAEYARPYPQGASVTLKGSAFRYDAAVRAVLRIRPNDQTAVVVGLQSRGRVVVELPDGSRERTHERYLSFIQNT